MALEQLVGETAPERLDEVLQWHFQLLDPDACVALDAVLEEAQRAGERVAARSGGEGP